MTDTATTVANKPHLRRLLVNTFALVTVLVLLVSAMGTGTAQAAWPRSGRAHAVAVLDWNRITYRVFAERSYPPPVQGLLGGYVATAVFGAVNAIEGG